MRNIFKSIVGALTIAGALATAVPAQARPDGWRDHREYRGHHGRHRDRDWDRPRYRHHYKHYRYRDYGRHYYPRGGYYSHRGYPRGYYRGYYRDDDTGAILAAGIIGLALGAAIASDRDRDGYRYRDYDY